MSAASLIFAYPPFNLEFLAWVAFIPLLYALKHPDPKRRFAVGYVFGIMFFSGILYWLMRVSVPGAVIFIMVLSLAPAIFSLLASPSVVCRPLSVVFVPASWVLTEYLRSHLFTGFPWALLGYSQSANLPIIQIANITGVYGVSFLILMANLSFYLLLTKTPRRFYIMFFSFIALVFVFAYGQSTMARAYHGHPLKVAVIQGNIPQEIKWSPSYAGSILDKYRTLTLEAVAEGPRLIVWPESSVPGYLEEEYYLRESVLNIAKETNAWLLVGTLRENDKANFNSAVLISGKGDIKKRYDKIHLVPFGEFIPLGKVFSWVRFFVNKPIGDYSRGTDLTVFRFQTDTVIRQDKVIQKTTNFYNFSSLICFEDIFPDLCRRFVRQGADFLVNMTNDAWFGKSSAPYQHMQGSIFRAVENRVPVVRAANTGVSCIINHKGEILKYVRDKNKEIFIDGYAVGTIIPVSHPTFYTRFGDIFSRICIACVLLSIFVSNAKFFRNVISQRRQNANG